MEDGFWHWLAIWAPTIWYTTAFIGFWFGSGAFVYRSVMRAGMSTGIQRLSDSPQTQAGQLPLFSHPGDRAVWTFSTPWALLISGILGPIGSFILAVFYFYLARALTRRAIRKDLERLRR